MKRFVGKMLTSIPYIRHAYLSKHNKGVLIHFHDIYYPFEYTREYLLEMKLVWNEVYNVHNFLLFNSSFKILFFSDYMRLKLAENAAFASNFPQIKASLYFNHPTRSKNFWIQRK